MSFGVEIEFDTSKLEKYLETTDIKLDDVFSALDFEMRTFMFNSESDAKHIAPVGKLPRSIDPLPHGKLRRSIHVEPRGDFSYSLVANARNIRGEGYAKYVDQGTAYMFARPFMGISINANLPAFIETIKAIISNCFRL